MPQAYCDLCGLWPCIGKSVFYVDDAMITIYVGAIYFPDPARLIVSSVYLVTRLHA